MTPVVTLLCLLCYGIPARFQATVNKAAPTTTLECQICSIDPLTDLFNLFFFLRKINIK